MILLLRALKATTDREIYNCIMQGRDKEEKNLFLSSRIELMLHQTKDLSVKYLTHILSIFKIFYSLMIMELVQ